MHATPANCGAQYSLFYAALYKRVLRALGYFVQRMKMDNALGLALVGRYSLVAGAL